MKGYAEFIEQQNEIAIEKNSNYPKLSLKEKEETLTLVSNKVIK